MRAGQRQGERLGRVRVEVAALLPEEPLPPETPAPRRSWGLFFGSIAKDKPDSARSLFSKHKRELPDSLWVSLSIAVEANPANLRKFASLMELPVKLVKKKLAEYEDDDPDPVPTIP
jgi:hypothetical protein